MKMWGWGGGGRESSRGRVRGTQGRFFFGCPVSITPTESNVLFKTMER